MKTYKGQIDETWKEVDLTQFKRERPNYANPKEMKTTVKIGLNIQKLHLAMKDGVVTRTSVFDKGVVMQYGTTHYEYFYNDSKIFSCDVCQGWGFSCDFMEIEIPAELASIMIERNYVMMTMDERANARYKIERILN